MMINATPNPFPFDALPPRLFNAVMAVANTTKSPYEMAACLALAVGAECVQGAFDVDMPQFGPVPLGVNLCLIAESGLGKTQVLKALRKPVRDYENHLREKFKAVADETKVRTESWEAIKFQILKSIRKATERGRDTAPWEAKLLRHEREKPSVLFEPNLSYSDSTPVALKMGLAKWPNAALVTDEASSFFGGRMARDFGFLNQVWDGTPIVLDRADATHSCKIEEPRLTLVLAVQPHAFASYMKKSGDQLRDLGASARFLFCSPLNNHGQRFRNQWELDHSGGLVGFEQRCKDLLSESVHDFAPINDKKLLRLGSMALPRFMDHHNYVEAAQRPFGWLHHVPDHASKVTRNTMKIAAILHLYGEQPETDISLQTLDAAIRISDYFTREFLSLFVGPPEVPQYLKDADDLYNWMWSRGTANNNRYLMKSDVQNRCPNWLRTPVVFENTISTLYSQGRLTVCKVQRIVYYDMCPTLPFDSVALSVAISASRSKRRKSVPQGSWYAADVAGTANVSQLAPPAA